MLDNKIFATNLNRHLNLILKLDISTVFHLTYNTLVSWVHKTYKGVPEYEVAYDKFIKYTRDVIHRNYYHRSSNKTHWFDDLFNYGMVYKYKNINAKLLTTLNQMPPETALVFLSELTGAWCLSCSREKATQYIKNENISDVELADALFAWLLRPFDYFN